MKTSRHLARRDSGQARAARSADARAGRAEQLRRAKRTQRERERAQGLALYQIRLPRAVIDKLRAGMAMPGFAERMSAFIDESVLRVRDYPQLALLCWNRGGDLISDTDAFALYERNWRFVDTARLTERESALIRKLARTHGGGILSV